MGIRVWDGVAGRAECRKWETGEGKVGTMVGGSKTLSLSRRGARKQGGYIPCCLRLREDVKLGPWPLSTGNSHEKCCIAAGTMIYMVLPNPGLR